MPKIKSNLAQKTNIPVQTEGKTSTVQEEWQKLVEDIANDASDNESEHSVSSKEDDNVNVVLRKDEVKVAVSTHTKRIEASDSSEEDEEQVDIKDKAAAWIDEDDILTTHELLEIQGRKVNLGERSSNHFKEALEERYKSIMGVPKWAKKKKGDSDVLTQTGSFTRKLKALKKDFIEVQQLGDLNKQARTQGSIIKSVLFHPGSTVALAAGISGTVSLFQVDGKENTKLQSIKYRRFPISCAGFLKSGDEFMIGSRHHKYFYSHDLIAGKSQRINNCTVDLTNMKNFSVTPDGKLVAICSRFGEIQLLASSSKEHIATLKMNGDVTSVGFHGNKMFSHGSDGEVYIWDLTTRDCVHKFIDEGCLTGTSIAASPNGKLLACGSSTGVVNIYDLQSCYVSKAPTPVKTMYNLVTEVDSVKFNATSEILALASQVKDNAIKLMNCSSMSVFSNFPSFTSKFHKIQCVDFSPHSGFLAFGNNASAAHLFRLKHYGNY